MRPSIPLQEENYEHQKELYRELRQKRNDPQASALKCRSEDFSRKSSMKKSIRNPSDYRESAKLSSNPDEDNNHPLSSKLLSSDIGFNLDTSTESKGTKKPKHIRFDSNGLILPHLKLQPSSTQSSRAKDLFSGKAGSDYWSFKPILSSRSSSKTTRLSIAASTAATNEIDSQLSLSSRRSRVKKRGPNINMDLFLMNKVKRDYEELPLFSSSTRTNIKRQNPQDPLEPLFGNSSKNIIKLKNLSLKASEVQANQDNLPPAFQEMLNFLKDNDSKIIGLEGDFILPKPTDRVRVAALEFDDLINSDEATEALATIEEGPRKNQVQNGPNFFLKTNKNIPEIKFPMTTTPKIPSRKSINLDNEKIKPIQNIKINSLQTPNKKQFYNKWYMPTEKWGVEKLPNYKDTLLKELRKNNLYIYQTIHNYKDGDPTRLIDDQDPKTIHQMRYETVQQKIKQNPMAYTIKRNMSDNHVRIPLFLKDV